MTSEEIFEAFKEANDKLDDIGIRSPNLDTTSKTFLLAYLHTALYFDVITKKDKSDIENIIKRAAYRQNKELEP